MGRFLFYSSFSSLCGKHRAGRIGSNGETGLGGFGRGFYLEFFVCIYEGRTALDMRYVCLSNLFV